MPIHNVQSNVRYPVRYIQNGAKFEVEPKSTFNLDRASNDYKTFLLTKLFQIATALILNFKRDDTITALFISFTN